MSINPYYKHRRVLIVGGSEGIGLATAKHLVSAGSHVIICSRSESKLKKAVQELIGLKRFTSQSVESRCVDATRFDQVSSVFSEVVCGVGVPDLVINCAGYARPGYLADLDVDDFQGMMNANYLSCVHVAKAILPYLVTNGGGHIVNTSSLAGQIGLFGYTGYCASKFAVIGFSKALRQELKPYNIDVSVLCPTNTLTPGFEQENMYKPAEVLQTEGKAKTMTADEVGLALLRGVKQKKFLIHPSLDGSFAHYLNRLFPAIVDYIVRRPESSSRSAAASHRSS